MKEIKRIMTNDGILLMTLPFGIKSISKLHRVYDQNSLIILLEEFNIEKIEYFQKTDLFWIRSSKEQVRDVDSSISEKAIACVKGYFK